MTKDDKTRWKWAKIAFCSVTRNPCTFSRSWKEFCPVNQGFRATFIQWVFANSEVKDHPVTEVDPTRWKFAEITYGSVTRNPCTFSRSRKKIYQVNQWFRATFIQWVFANSEVQDHPATEVDPTRWKLAEITYGSVTRNPCTFSRSRKKIYQVNQWFRATFIQWVFANSKVKVR